MFCALCGINDRRNARMRADRAGTSLRVGRSAIFLADRTHLSCQFRLQQGRCRRLGHDGGARNLWIAARMTLIMAPVTATSAFGSVMARECRTTRAPILISLSWGDVSDQLAMASGSSMQREATLPGCRQGRAVTAALRCRGTACTTAVSSGRHACLP